VTALIAGNEIRVLCRSPFAWIAAGMLQLVFGWMFLSALEQYLEIQPTLANYSHAGGLSAYLATHWLTPISSVFLLATPLLCMNLIAAERQSGRYALLASSAVSSRQIVAGKFTGAVIFQLLVLTLNLALIACLQFATQLDTSALMLAWLGMALFICSATAISLFFSCLTSRPALAALCSFVFLLMLWLLATTQTREVGIIHLAQLSPATHLQHFIQGQLHSNSLAYFLLCIALFIILSIRQLEALRYTGAHRID